MDGSADSSDAVLALSRVSENPLAAAVAGVITSIAHEERSGGVKAPKPTLPPVPMSVVVGGPPRSGKSEIAAKLSRQVTVLTGVLPASQRSLA